MTTWTTALVNLRKANSPIVKLLLLLTIIRKRYNSRVKIGATEIEMDGFPGRPTGRARTWICFDFEYDQSLKLVTYNIMDVLNNGTAPIGRINSLTNTVYSVNGTEIRNLLNAINFDVCVDRKTGETDRVRPAQPAVPCTYRRCEDGSPCKPVKVDVPAQISAGGGGVGGGGGTFIDKAEAAAALVETINVQPKFLSRETRPQAIVAEVSPIHYDGSSPDFPLGDEDGARRLAIRYWVALLNKLGVTPMVMWRGIGYAHLFVAALYDCLKDTSPGETFILVLIAHGTIGKDRYSGWLETCYGSLTWPSIRSVILHAAPPGVRVLVFNESCNSGSQIFGGSPFAENQYIAATPNASAVNTETRSSSDHVLSILADKPREKTVLEKELDDDKSEYIVPEFIGINWKDNYYLEYPDSEFCSRVNTLIRALNALGRTNPFTMQMSSSPWNKDSFFQFGVAEPFLGGLVNSWLATIPAYGAYLQRYPDSAFAPPEIPQENEPAGEDEEESPVKPVRPKFVNDTRYMKWITDRNTLGLGFSPWLGINSVYLPQFMQFFGLTEINYNQSSYNPSIAMLGFTYNNWFMMAAKVANRFNNANNPTLTHNVWVSSSDTALGDFSDKLAKYEKSKEGPQK